MHRYVFAKDFYDVALFAWHIGDINHARIHAYVAHSRRILSVDVDATASVAKSAIHTVGISDRDSRYPRFSAEHSTTSVAHRLTLVPLSDSDDDGAQRRHHCERSLYLGRQCVGTIESDAEACHVVVILWETDYAGRVEHMALDFAWITRLHIVGQSVEALQLHQRVVVHVGAIGRRKMGEYRCSHDVVLRVEYLHDMLKFRLQEAHAMHACVEFDVDRIILDAILFGFTDHILEHRDAVDFRLKMEGKHGLIVDHLRIHHHDRHSDTGLAKVDTLIEHSDSQIGSALCLERLGYLVASRAITRSLHHCDKSGRSRQMLTEIVVVFDHRIEVDLKHSLMLASLEVVLNAFEVKLRCTLDEYQLVAKVGGRH